MIRPHIFGSNPLTVESNAFQHRALRDDVESIKEKAKEEWEAFVHILKEKEVQLSLYDDLPERETPDATFPNNWISFHGEGQIVLYPMFAPNRRRERRMDIVEDFLNCGKIELWDMASECEDRGLFLEGTGSLVLDRKHKVAYACVSERTHAEAFDHWTQRMGYQGMIFQAIDEKGQAIYHTNVMMCIGESFVLVCMDALPDPQAREALRQKIKTSGRKLVAITIEQMHAFAGNMLEIKNLHGDSFLVMSKRAHDSLTEIQLRELTAHAEAMVIPLDVIETYGGGSVRCMMAEVFLPE